ncbi:MAG: ABC transporter ATP-binding protein [Nanoarchaeota archaeon]|nr:ABC transporter ATP-binding protein [Nanoarchaeota archaeon]MBU1269446.1 ABC transporter ATP-binding protein [Nanoarchaeota archaeon]MBU1604603.1 ABC transporter ATP-binding protein [Nanoarchaeota archaeon]MBU2442753.1 ABC transporter ATP-binding protein [Nanoarchaeota archaeon]
MNVAIKLNAVTKNFSFYAKSENTLFHSFKSIFKRDKHVVISAIDRLSLEINTGEIIGIIGPNGCGKTTLLKIVGGILSPTKGTVKVMGKTLPLLELGTAFQESLSLKDNIFLYGSILGLSTETLKKRLTYIIDFSGIRQTDTNIKNFSSGMKLRLAFSIAKEVDADIYLLDEILTVGDEGFQKKCFVFFENLKRQGKTILLVTHDLSLVARECDRAILLDNGKLVADGESSSMVKKYLSIIINNDLKLVKKQLRVNKPVKELSLAFSKLRMLFEQLLMFKQFRNISNTILPFYNLETLIKNREAKKLFFGELRALLNFCYEHADEKEKLFIKNLVKNALQEELFPLENNEMMKIVVEDSKTVFDKEIKIKKVLFKDEMGVDGNVFETGKSMSIEIIYQALKDVKRPMFGIAIFDSTDHLITGPNTTFYNVTSESIKNSGVVTYVIKSLPLLKGTYKVSVSIYDELGSKPFDYHEKKYGFKVVEKDIKSLGGIINMDGRWIYK